MAEVYLIRHGETDSRGICIGRTDIPLSETGMRRSEAMARWLHDTYPNIGRIYASPLDRAVQTAEFFAARYALPMDIVSDLQEIDMGEWDGCRFADIREQYPREYEQRGRKPWQFRVENGESFAEAGERFEKIIKAMTEGNEDKIVIAHKGVISAFLVRCGICAEKDVLKTVCPNLSLITVSRRGSEWLLSGQPFRPCELMDDEMISDLYRRHETPENVQAHMKAVAAYCEKLLDVLPARYDRKLIIKAALVHDLDRTARHHAEAAAAALREEGFAEITDLVSVHHDEEYEENASLTDADILWYADKCILEDQYVGIEERFAASRKKCRNEEALRHHEKRHAKALWIEKKIEEERIA